MAPRSVFAVDRSIWEDADFADEPFTEREAWMWLVGRASWKDGPVRGTTGSIDLKRGEFCVAIRYMAERWKWSKSRVDRFLKRLENRDMIRDATRDGDKSYYIKNYNAFQVVGVPKRDAEKDSSGTAAGQKRNTETGKQKKDGGPVAPKLPGLQFPDWWPTKEWAAFVEMRRKIKKPLTEHAVELAIGRLSELRAAGENPAEVLNKAVFGAWQGLYGRDDGRRGAGAPAAAPSGPTDWLWRLETFHHGQPETDEEQAIRAGYWQAKWGPEPGKAGCLVPAEAIEAYRRRRPPAAVGAA